MFDDVLSLRLSLEGKCCLNAVYRHCAIEYRTKVLLDRCLAPRPGLWNANGQGTELYIRCLAHVEDALDDLVAIRCWTSALVSFKHC